MVRAFLLFIFCLVGALTGSAGAQVPPGTGAFGDIVYGDPDAPIEVVEYASLTCPHCKTWAETVMPQLLEKYVETGQVKLVFRNAVLNQLDLAAAMVARCRTPDVAKRLTQKLFEHQQRWMSSPDVAGSLKDIAAGEDIGPIEFQACLRNTKMRDHIVAMTQDAFEKQGVESTPTVFVNGIKVGTTWDILDTRLSLISE